MGWLFAVARGLQEKRLRAVLESLLPIAIGHEASIVMVVVAVSLTEQVVPPFFVRLLAALVLVSFGLYKLARPRSHPGGFGMRVGPAGLAMWSFLMSSAHGAGLMLAPVLLGLPVYATYHSLSEISLQAVAAASLHVVAMLLVMGVVAVVIYEKVGLGVLRRGWFDLDMAWSFVLIASGAVTLFTAISRERYWRAVVKPSRTPRIGSACRKRTERSADRPAATSWITVEAATNACSAPLSSPVANKARARAAWACQRRGGAPRRSACSTASFSAATPSAPFPDSTSPLPSTVRPAISYLSRRTGRQSSIVFRAQSTASSAEPMDSSISALAAARLHSINHRVHALVLADSSHWTRQRFSAVAMSSARSAVCIRSVLAFARGIRMPAASSGPSSDSSLRRRASSRSKSSRRGCVE